MKVVQINAVYKSSSTGRLTEELHLYMKSHGLDSYVFCTNLKDTTKNIYKIGSKLDYRFHSLLSRVFGKQAYFSRGATKIILEKLSIIKPDVVILGNLHGNYINLPMLLNYLSINKIATIIILHDCWFFTGHCCYYTEDQCEKWKTKCVKCPILHKYNRSLFFDNSSFIFEDKQQLFNKIGNLTVIGVSDWIKNEAKQSPILENATSFRRVYNWLNLEVFKPLKNNSLRDKLQIDKKRFVILGVSQLWSEYKGLYRFIQLAHDQADSLIVLVGNIPKNITLPSNIMSVGPTSNIHELAQYYNMADVFVNFSIQETFGLVSAEAIACGTPLITNTVTANPEICGEGCGYIVNLEEWQKVIASIEEVKRNTKSFYTKDCRKFALANFNKNVCLHEYLKIIHDVAIKK